MQLNNYNNSNYTPGRRIRYIIMWNLLGRPIIKFISSDLLFSKTINTFKILLLKLFGAKIGKGCVIKNIDILYPWKITIGNDVWVGSGANLYSLGTITIGNNVCISQNVFLCTGSHNPRAQKFDLITDNIIIEDHVWIGANSFVGPKVILFKGAVAAAGSIIVKDLPSWKICAGNPCLPIKDRIIQ